MYKFTLGRKLDLEFSSNRFIIGLTVIAFFCLLLRQVILVNLDSASLFFAIEGASACFLVWALGREIDPDRNSVANMGALLMFAIYLIFAVNQFILVALLILMIIRYIIEPTGLSVNWFDYIVLLLFGTVSYLVTGQQLIFILIVLGFLMSLSSKQSSRDQMIRFLVLIIGVLILNSIFPVKQGLPILTIGNLLIMLALGVCLLFNQYFKRQVPKLQTDVSKQKFSELKLLFGKLYYVLCVIIALTISDYRQLIILIIPLVAYTIVSSFNLLEKVEGDKIKQEKE